MTLDIHTTKFNNKNTAQGSSLFAPGEMEQIDRSELRSKAIKIATLAFLITLLIGVGLYFTIHPGHSSLDSSTTPSNAQQPSTDKSVSTTPLDTPGAGINSTASQTGTKSTQQGSSSTNGSATQSNQNSGTQPTQQQTNSTSQTEALNQQAAAAKAAQDQQAAQYATCQTQKAAATAPIAQQIKSTTTSYNGAYNAWKSTAYSSDPSSEYQRLMGLTNTYAAQLNSLQGQLSTTNSQYSC